MYNIYIYIINIFILRNTYIVDNIDKINLLNL